MKRIQNIIIVYALLQIKQWKFFSFKNKMILINENNNFLNAAY